MSKGWYVKVETNVVFSVDTNIGVVASTEEQAELEAQNLVREWLSRDNYRDVLEVTLPWELEMGGLEWNRGSWSGDIAPQSMRAVYAEPDPDFDPDEDEEPISECCGATLLHYENGLGLCADCKEWSGPYEEEVKEDAAVVRDLMEAAQCLNEAYHNLGDGPLQMWGWRHGIAEVRDQLNLCAIYCDNLYRLMMDEQGYDGCFDFDFCPQFLETCVDHETFKPKSTDMRVLSMYFSRIGE